MFLRLFILSLFISIHVHLHAQTDTRAILHQQVALYKKEFNKQGYIFEKESQGLMNKTNLSTMQLSLQSGFQYRIIAFVDCDFCDLKMHYWNKKPEQKTPIYPKESRNLGISAFSYNFKQEFNSKGQLVTYVNASKAYFGRILIFRKRN